MDPENRCAVMLVYGTQLVVLPFRKDTLTDEQEGGVGEGYGCSPLHILLMNILLSLQQHKCLHVNSPVGMKPNLTFVVTKCGNFILFIFKCLYYRCHKCISMVTTEKGVFHI